MLSASFVGLPSLHQILDLIFNTVCPTDARDEDFFKSFHGGPLAFTMHHSELMVGWPEAFVHFLLLTVPQSLALPVAPYFSSAWEIIKPVLPLSPNPSQVTVLVIMTLRLTGVITAALTTSNAVLVQSDWSEPTAGSIVRLLPEELALDWFSPKVEPETRIWV